MPERPFVTTGDIIKLAKVHPNTVAMWRSTGKIVAVDRIGSSFLYDRKKVIDFITSRSPKKIKK